MILTGSPPRVRGKLPDTGNRKNAKRITPACAGKTVRRLGLRRARKDHPRVCGENEPTHCRSCVRLGSPPRVRGKQKYQPFPAILLRITPACAGKTCDGARL